MAEMKRREFPQSVRREIVGRAWASGVLRCEGCGADLTGKRTEVDHVIPEGLVPEWKKATPLTAKDGQLLGQCCHRGEDGKTSKDVTQIAKAKRQMMKSSGLKAKAQKIPSRPFPKADREREPGKQLPPVRGLYRGVKDDD
jgi:hypothetical protein